MCRHDHGVTGHPALIAHWRAGTGSSTGVQKPQLFRRSLSDLKIMHEVSNPGSHGGFCITGLWAPLRLSQAHPHPIQSATLTCLLTRPPVATASCIHKRLDNDRPRFPLWDCDSVCTTPCMVGLRCDLVPALGPWRLEFEFGNIRFLGSGDHKRRPIGTGLATGAPGVSWVLRGTEDVCAGRGSSPP